MIPVVLPHGCPGLTGYERLPGMFVCQSIVPVQPSTCLIAELRCCTQRENRAESVALLLRHRQYLHASQMSPRWFIAPAFKL